MADSWKRPPTVPYPSTWEVFEGRHPLPNGQRPRIKIQDLTDDLIEECVLHMTSRYLNAEPYACALGLGNIQEAIDEMTVVWRNGMKHQMALVALLDNADELEDKSLPKIAGCNITVPALPNAKNLVIKNSQVQKWVTLLEDFTGKVDVFKKYNVPIVMASFGLSVDPLFRGQGIGEKLLQARFPLGRSLGIKVTSTLFTHFASQHLAEKLGWDLLFEMKSEDYKKNGEVVFKDVACPFIKLTAARID